LALAKEKADKTQSLQAEAGTAVGPVGPAQKLRAADRIRQTARALFYREGIRAVGVDEIVTQAGVTKPSLYRSFASKDELAAAYLRDYDAEFWNRFDACVAAHPGNAKAQFLEYVRGLGQRASRNGYRGCGLTNAAVEYPAPDHPARHVALENKIELRRRLRLMAREMGARDPDKLGDGLLLLLEGTYASGQLFGDDGPAQALAEIAERLIDASLGK
jgi:AcrR family transcriptional regulator